jgi:hypothetical protein
MAEHLAPTAPIDLHRLWRAALFGAIGAVALCLLLWATAAAKAAPDTYPAWIRDFGPSQGLERLWLGLLVSGLSGAMLLGLVATAWELVRHGGGTGPSAQHRLQLAVRHGGGRSSGVRRRGAARRPGPSGRRRVP